jgi:hypothetical protein
MPPKKQRGKVSARTTRQKIPGGTHAKTVAKGCFASDRGSTEVSSKLRTSSQNRTQKISQCHQFDDFTALCRNPSIVMDLDESGERGLTDCEELVLGRTEGVLLERAKVAEHILSRLTSPQYESEHSIPLLLLANSGSGKSTFVANLVRRLRR